MALALFSGTLFLGAILSPQKIPHPGASLPELCVDVNRAPAGELDSLPGIGASTAERIVEHRRDRGPFLRVDDLLEVKGVGPAKLATLAPLICAPGAGVSGSGE